MGKFSRPFNEPKFDNSTKAIDKSNLFDTDVSKSSDDFLLMQFRLFVDEVQNIIKTSRVTVPKNNTDKDLDAIDNKKESLTNGSNQLRFTPEENLAKQVNNSLCKLIEVQNIPAFLIHLPFARRMSLASLSVAD